MQGLADGYFILPYTIGNYLATSKPAKISTDHPEFKKAEAEVNARNQRFLNMKGQRTVDSFHKELGKIMWEYCGMARTEEGLKKALEMIPKLREEFQKNLVVLGGNDEMNQSLEKAGRVADFIELGELMCRDALERRESCGGHFRVEFQDEGEAKRDDANFAHVAAWEYTGEDKAPRRNIEPLNFEYVHLQTRSYK